MPPKKVNIAQVVKAQQNALKRAIQARIRALNALKKRLQPPKVMVPPRAKAPPNPAPMPAPQPPAGAQPRQQGRAANTTTCDIYRGANAPPGDPNVAGVPCALIANFREGSEASEGDQDFRFTHILLVDANVDIRDNYPSAPSDNDVFIPDKDGTGFEVVFVELVNRGQPGAYLRVFLDRKEPAWPTDQL